MRRSSVLVQILSLQVVRESVPHLAERLCGVRALGRNDAELLGRFQLAEERKPVQQHLGAGHFREQQLFDGTFDVQVAAQDGDKSNLVLQNVQES